MVKLIPIFLLTIFFAYSCSSTDEKSKSKNSSSDEFSFEDDQVSDGEDFEDFEDVDFDNDAGADEVASTGTGQADDSSEIIYGDDLDDEDFDDDFDNEVSEEVAEFDDEFEVFDDEPQRGLSSAVTIGGEVSRYKVKRGETLMLIAFNLYGDYTKWKRLRNINPGINANNLSAGQVIKYEVPEEEFVWSPNGKPYLIKQGDTLGKISSKKYGTPKKWRDLYENNRPMIRNPNLIFAGFTLYYIDGESDFAYNN